jgi:undecaprenyl diphosphate synthase
MIRERPTFIENRVRLRTVGVLEELPAPVLREIRITEELTREHSGMTLTLALNYGGRREIVGAAQKLLKDYQAGIIDPETLSEDDFAQRLDLFDMPDVDMLLRTGGELRISNFLLWQISYAELYVTETCWPDFREPELLSALDHFRQRSRRFGGLLQGDKRS